MSFSLKNADIVWECWRYEFSLIFSIVSCNFLCAAVCPIISDQVAFFIQIKSFSSTNAFVLLPSFALIVSQMCFPIFSSVLSVGGSESILIQKSLIGNPLSVVVQNSHTMYSRNRQSSSPRPSLFEFSRRQGVISRTNSLLFCHMVQT